MFSHSPPRSVDEYATGARACGNYAGMQVVVATHGHCFDGLASSVLFTHLLKQLHRGTNLEFGYRGCGYGSKQQKPSAALLSGRENAILDYRYAALPKLSWYFDHHRTAFGSPAERADFERRKASGRMFFEPSYSSCAKLIADVARERFGVEHELLNDLVHWADLVDAARFESAQQAVDRREPILRLVSVVEHYGDDGFLSAFVPRLLEQPLAEVAGAPDVEERYRPLGEKHQRFIERVRTKLQRSGRVVFVDLTDAPVESVGKFVTYALCPESVYSVIVARMTGGAKISVGYNPWCGQPLDADISEICARHGGGGHPVVGGISFRASDLEKARMISQEIVAELSG